MFFLCLVPCFCFACGRTCSGPSPPRPQTPDPRPVVGLAGHERAKGRNFFHTWWEGGESFFFLLDGANISYTVAVGGDTPYQAGLAGWWRRRVANQPARFAPSIQVGTQR